ncbi:MAG: radical SAM protein [Candidatus Riflebacteria bacterium]|nr:radical SAM protein [Candidatus Riflebacteria bacterium]
MVELGWRTGGDRGDGWVALVGPELEENLSLRYLSSSLETAGFPTRIVSFNCADDFGPVLRTLLGAAQPPLLVGLSLSFQWRAMDFLSLAMALKRDGYGGHVTAGGHFASLSCGEILSDFPELDSILRGEAEHSIVRLARCLLDGRPLSEVPGIALRDRGGPIVFGELEAKPALESLSWPDRRGERVAILGHGVAPLVSGRGCYAGCAFCCIATFHRRTLPGPRLRLRPPEDVAGEMAWLNRERGIDIFIFHDDNFLLADEKKSLERIEALANAVDECGIGPYATVVKARPNDITDATVRCLKERFGLIRLFLGVESNSEQGLRTLGRGVTPEQNARALATLRSREVYVCFNVLLFDPDTTLDGLRTNLTLIEENGDYPSNFGRVELYAGTPLLERMLREGRAFGDYLQWDYLLASREMQRVFELAMRCFFPRNFAAGALANRLMGTRLDAEVCRRFHPAVFREEWLREAEELTRALARDSARSMRKIVEFVEAGPGGPDEEDSFVAALSERLHAVDAELAIRAESLEKLLRDVSGRCTVTEAPERGSASVGGSHANR